MVNIKIIVVIPAHLASVRFPRKILFPIFDLPMIEHVRRRAKLCSIIDEVFVATCDEEIAAVVNKNNGNVLMTGNHHQNGTTRVCEAIKDMDISHVILLQGDEPLIKPAYIEKIVSEIKNNPHHNAWNITGPLAGLKQVDKNSFVKCAVSSNDDILYCFRRGPSHQSFQMQSQYIRKILGIIAYKKDFLLELEKMRPTLIEKVESIEQMRIIEAGYRIKSVSVDESLPSVNEPKEVNTVIEHLMKDKEQRRLLLETTGLTFEK